MAVLGNRPPALQSVGQNATNAMRQNLRAGTGRSPQGTLSVPGATGTYSNAGRPITVAHGTPQRNYQQFLDAGTPLTFRSPHQLGTSQWNYSGPQMVGTQPRQQTSLPQTQQQPGGAYGGIPGMAQTTSSITPRPIYQPWMTQIATNTVQAQADQASNAPYLMKMFDRPGVSRSDAHFAAIAPLVAENQVGAATARAQIPFEDAMANERNLFLGQVARENESLQLGNLMARINEANQQSRLNQTGRLSSLLSGLIG